MTITTHRVALVGVSGFGRTHIGRIAPLAEAGRAQLVAWVDTRPPDPATAARLNRLGATGFDDLSTMLEHAAPEVVVIATPPHLHAPMTRAAMAAGAHVLVEKPPAVTMTALDSMTVGDRLCQVGFQCMGSTATDRLTELARSGRLGEITHVGAGGHWIRTDSYYARSAWAGQRVVAGTRVNDGALSNPFAHAVMAAMAIAGTEPTPAVTAELWRARPIAVDDTASVRISSPGAVDVLAAVTLCAEESANPCVQVCGRDGTARWWYGNDRIDIHVTGHDPISEHATRVDPLANLLDVLDGRVAQLQCPSERTRPFVAAVEQWSSQPVAAVPDDAVTWSGAGDERAVHIHGIDGLTERAMQDGRLFSELGLPWTSVGP